MDEKIKILKHNLILWSNMDMNGNYMSKEAIAFIDKHLLKGDVKS